MPGPIRRSAATLATLTTVTALAVVLGCAPSAHVHPRAAAEVEKGYRYLASGDLERADVAFAHALEFNEDTPEALNGAGVVARTHGDLPGARGWFEHAVRVNPDFAEGWVNLGELELASGRDGAAEADFRTALRVDPDLVVARLDLARTLLHRGLAEASRRPELWARARREYLHLLESRPDVAEAHHDLGFMDYELGEWPHAADEYRRAAELSPRYVEALHGLCVASARAGRCTDAATACQRCLDVAPSDPRCAVSLKGVQSCESGRSR